MEHLFDLRRDGEARIAVIEGETHSLAGREAGLIQVGFLIVESNGNEIAMNIDLQRRYELPSDFFDLCGSVVMKLSAEAAIASCLAAAEYGLIIAKVEGGIWHYPGFEARLDCIWDGVDPPVTQQAAEENNLAAANFIRSQKGIHDVFVLTAPSISGW